MDTFAASFQACHPLETALVNEPALLLPPIIAGLSYELTAVWIMLGTIGAITSHCGMAIPYFGGDPHDYHHHDVRCEFGVPSKASSVFTTTSN